MKILHVYKTYYPDTIGGVEKMIHQLAISSNQLGIETHILALSKTPHAHPFLFDGHYVHHAKSHFQFASSDFSLTAFSLFEKLVNKADVVHYHYPWPFMDLLHLLTRHDKPSVLTYHSDIVRQVFLSKLYSPLKKLFLNSVDKIIATSPNYIKTSIDLAQYNQKTEIIPIGIDTASSSTLNQATITHWFKQLPERFFLFVGVLRYYKGLHILLEALQYQSYPVIIAGTGPIEAQLKERAKQLNLTNVIFLGQISEEDKDTLFHLSYCVIFPSYLRSEAFGISLLEGAMHGKPLISSEIGTGTTYINIHKETGLVVKAGCPQSLAEAIKHIWENPSKAKEMGLAAKVRYKALFTAEKMALSYEKLYKGLIEAKKPMLL